jgi:hypothetical protein
MTLAAAASLFLISLRWLALPAASAGVPPPSDSLTISGVVRTQVGLRQLHAHVRVVRCTRMARSSSQMVASTWTNQQGFFLLRISPAEAADSLLIRVLCPAQPWSTSYLLGAEKLVDVARQRPYTIWLHKRRIYPKAR